MADRTLLVTGSSGLIGSESVAHFSKQGWKVVGIDNNLRRFFFGAGADTDPVKHRMLQEYSGFIPFFADIRDHSKMRAVFSEFKPDAVIHAAGQPSHDWAAKNPALDWDVNAQGTFNLLMAVKDICPETPFIFMSTNKVYGTIPNQVSFEELETRYYYKSAYDRLGVSEETPIDQSYHSIFGASKIAADLMVQEFGHVYGLPTVCFRAGCITGKSHAAVAPHGFLAYLARSIMEGLTYTIYGYKGKQVRDNLHASDLASAFEAFIKNPSSAAVYNIGGGAENSLSILEAARLMEIESGKVLKTAYDATPRTGDHICYVSDTRKFSSDYPSWKKKMGVREIISELAGEEHRLLRPLRNA